MYQSVASALRAPALTERPGDLPGLVRYLLGVLNAPHPGVSDEVMALLRSYQWPGNIRELKNVIERAVILSRGKVLRLDLAMSDILNSGGVAEPSTAEGVVRLMTEAELLDLERQNTLLALERAEWRVSGPNGAAKLLGIKPTTLADRIKKLKLRKPSSAGPRSVADRRTVIVPKDL